jgi:peptide/nickel transport system substrate-binding protein
MQRRALALALAAVLAAAACAPSAPVPATGSPVATSAAPRAAAPSVLRLARSTEVEYIFHPVLTSSDQMMLYYLVFNQLVHVKSDSQTVTPDLAERWEVSPDASEYTFSLRPGVKWHDGTAFSARDVVFTATWTAQAGLEAFGRAFTPAWFEIKGAAAIKGTKNPLPGVQALDENAVRITLETPNAEFLRNLADPQNSIMPQHLLKDVTAAEVDKISFSTKQPIGTGPYKVVKVEPGQFVEFETNASYFKGKPKIDKVFYKPLGPEITVAQLESGDLDLALQVSATEFDRLSKNTKLNVISAPNVGIARMDFRVETALFKDKRVRQAFYYAIDRRGIVKAVLKERARVLINPPGFKEYADLNTYPFDPAKARQLLREANFDFGKTVRLIYNQGHPNYNEILPIVQQQLQDVGVKVQLIPLDTQAWVDQFRKRTTTGDADYDITMSTGGFEALSPDRSRQYFGCNMTQLANTGYQNCEMMDLFAKARSVADPATRDELYHQIAKILNEDVPGLNLYSPNLVHVATKRLGGGFAVHVNHRESVMNVETWELAQQ